MTDFQIATIAGKALNRDVICIEHTPGNFCLFLSEKDKAAYLSAPNDHLPAASIIIDLNAEPEEGRYGWIYQSYSNNRYTNDEPLETMQQCLCELLNNWFCDYFLAAAFL